MDTATNHRTVKEPRSVILAVISAKNDLANQLVLNLAKMADPSGNRTMGALTFHQQLRPKTPVEALCSDIIYTGIITKPDTLIPGSSSEAFYASLARNEEVEFRLGWHVLKNMDTEKGVVTLKKRDADEKQFFSEGIWQLLPAHLLGIAALGGRLSKVLMNQIANELPNVISDITSKLKSCQEQLGKLGQPRATPNEQRYYLLHVSQSFQTLVKASVDGTYNDAFFEDPETDRGYQQRIRAVIQNMNRDFAKVISEKGHCREITTTEITTTAAIQDAEPAEPVEKIDTDMWTWERPTVKSSKKKRRCDIEKAIIAGTQNAQPAECLDGIGIPRDEPMDSSVNILEDGHHRETPINAGTQNAKPAESVHRISRDEFVDHIQELMRRTRGRELPCTFNPMIVANLFLEQCRPWRAILEGHVQRVWSAAKGFLELVCVHVADEMACKYLLSDIVEPAFDHIMESLGKKTEELLQPHQEGHPITYNQQFFESFQKSRDDRRRAEVVQAIKHSLKITDEQVDSGSTVREFYAHDVNFLQLVNSLAKRSESDVDRFAASEALDCMEAYYKVRRRPLGARLMPPLFPSSFPPQSPIILLTTAGN